MIPLWAHSAGFYVIFDGTKQVVRVPGGPGENVGNRALALANNGRLVIAKYSRICFVGNGGDDDMGQDQVNYFRT